MTDRQAAAKDWLTRNEFRFNEIKSLELRLEEMRDQVNKSVSEPKEICVQTQPRNVQAEKIADIVDFEKKIDDLKLRYKELEQVTIQTIEKLRDPVKANILLFRYVYHRSWAYIAGKMHYKESYIFALHIKALDSIYPLIDFTAD